MNETLEARLDFVHGNGTAIKRQLTMGERTRRGHSALPLPACGEKVGVRGL
jgi:hypothetical protein